MSESSVRALVILLVFFLILGGVGVVKFLTPTERIGDQTDFTKMSVSEKRDHMRAKSPTYSKNKDYTNQTYDCIQRAKAASPWGFSKDWGNQQQPNQYNNNVTINFTGQVTNAYNAERNVTVKCVYYGSTFQDITIY